VASWWSVSVDQRGHRRPPPRWLVGGWPVCRRVAPSVHLPLCRRRPGGAIRRHAPDQGV